MQLHLASLALCIAVVGCFRADSRREDRCAHRMDPGIGALHKSLELRRAPAYLIQSSQIIEK